MHSSCAEVSKLAGQADVGIMMSSLGSKVKILGHRRPQKGLQAAFGPPIEGFKRPTKRKLLLWDPKNLQKTRFVAYLRGIETPTRPVGARHRAPFVAYLRGIETACGVNTVREETQRL